MSTNLARKIAATPAPKANVVSDTGATALLSSLVAFLKPVIQGYATSPALIKSTNQTYHTDAELIKGSEAKNLLSALTAFVEVAVLVAPEAHRKQAKNPPDVVDNQPTSEVVGAPEIPKEAPRSELETKTLVAASAHVVNKMPIRLLFFDETGSDIQLIERNEIFSCILPTVFARIREPEFQSKWAAAEGLEDSEVEALSTQYRSNRMKELLQEVVDQSVHYAILSHTWIRDTPGDITFPDWATREHNPRGNAKIIKFCEVAARNHNVTLGWIDSVCINKDSSSELDESIRSMYNWYRRASVCITFLSETASIPNAQHDSWFTRGWTLQELLAPADSVFYNDDWKKLGCSSDTKIRSIITMASGITSKELELSWSGSIDEIPLSRRMQMACSRQVTREEDTSYSLMGILGVDIPVSYGEGANRAFCRLVRELFNTKKNIIDLFNRSYEDGEDLTPSALESYRYRDNCWDNSDGRGTSLDKYLPIDPFTPTHLGMRISLLLAPWFITDTVDNKNYVPKGALSAKSSTTFYHLSGERTSIHLLLCDKRLYNGDLDDLFTSTRSALQDGIPNMYMAGIINFGVDSSGHILLPERCFSLRLSWDGLEQGNFTPPGHVLIVGGTAGHFSLESVIDSELKIPQAKLGEHGVQLVTLYL